ncbi:bifunctional DNA primase/polymerase [Microbacterium sp. PAMC21962]|uniref:bifunctional DNA primase/polymerase n=1 Tax=Microbacterium sp. PAMC21962 TaxID=2861280 RepID=UPI001C631B38|nr:bifunctional DNA primase/polymerase [Microbacterium sp. PAMC21962]QYF98278.1 bifunctional DNA primase/polymerase [Microbacterium sp. PAMC21962]
MSDGKKKAQALGALGLPVFPVRPLDAGRDAKTPYPGTHGHLAATTDRGQIAKMWKKHPEAIPAVWTGGAGIVGLDVDKKPGKDGRATLRESNVDVPRSPLKYATPSGGYHAFYAEPEGFEIPNGVADIAYERKRLTGVDRRSGSSYVVWWGDVPATLPKLPTAPDWLIATSGVSDSGERVAEYEGSVEKWLDKRGGGKPSLLMRDAMERTPRDDFGRNELFRRMVEIVSLGAEGQKGARRALDDLRSEWLRGEWNTADGAREFETSLGRVVKAHGKKKPPTITTLALDEPHELREDESEAGDTWRARDVSEALRGVLAGDVDRPAPTIGRVEGLGAGIFYPGRVSGVHGESGVGKSWLVWLVFAQEITAGHHVVLVDYEDSIDAALQRLLDLDASPADIERFFHYVQPEERSAAGIAYLEALVVELGATLVGIDSTGEGLSIDGVQPNADEEVAAWFRNVPRRLANLGPAVAVLDHSPKATGDGELFPIGSQRKRSAINGAQYLLRAGAAFSQGKAGYSTLICAKDRGGHYAKGSRVARLAVSAEGGFTLTAEQAPVEDFRPTALMERVSRFIESSSTPPSRNAVEDNVTGNKAAIARAIDQLVAEGFVRRDPGPRKSTLHTSLGVYRQANDPKSDAYVPATATTLPLETTEPTKRKSDK